MAGHWVRAPRMVNCATLDCQRSMLRDDAVYLINGIANQAICPACALKRFLKEPPRDLPHLTAVAEPVVQPALSLARQLPLSDSTDRPAVSSALKRFEKAWMERTLAREKRKNRRVAAEANAQDGKLRQIGGDR